jgi:hypothetical protein
MNHQKYGILLFITLLILFYLLNFRGRVHNNISEGFENKSLNTRIINDYVEYQNTYMHLDGSKDKKWKDQTLDKCLTLCSNDKDCYGITRSNSDSDTAQADCHPIYNLSKCQTTYQGSGEERSMALNYKTFIKKSLDDHEHLCISSNNLNRGISIKNANDLYWLLEDDKVFGYSSSYIEIEELYPRSSFKVVEGLYGNGTVSFQSLLSKHMNKFLVHNYPRRDQLYLEDKNNLKTSEDNARASFRVSSGLNGKGISLKILKFPEVYVRFENKTQKRDRLIVIPIENNNQINDLATFYFQDQLTKNTINTSTSSNDVDTSTSGNDIDNTPKIITPLEKIKKVKTKNLHDLEKQKALLEKQNQQILDFDFSQANRVSYIGRELAKQASYVELGNYLKEQEDIQLLDRKLQNQNQNGVSIPNKENFRYSL